MISSVQKSGMRPQFPSVRTYLKNFLLGLEDWESRDLIELQKYASGEMIEIRLEAEGQVLVLPFNIGAVASRMSRVSVAYRWMAVQAMLGEHEGATVLWMRSVAYKYWKSRIEIRFHTHALAQFKQGERPQKLKMLLLHQFGAVIANCLSLGWTDWAIDLTKKARWGLDNELFNDGDDESHRRTHHFILRLVGRWQDWPEREEPSCAFDEPLFNVLLDGWATLSPDEIAPLLIAACDRHTYQARPDSNKACFDMPYSGLEYDPFEVLAVMKLRELHGLPNPVLDHVLMNTPLGRLPSSTAPYTDKLLDGVLAQARCEFFDL